MAATRISEMESIRQTGTISEYCKVFQDWFEQVQILEGFSDFYGVYLFICGLRSEIREIFDDWHQYSCNMVEDVISLALKIDANGLQDSFSPFDPTSSFYKKELEFDFRISLDEIMKDNEFFKNGKIQEISKEGVNVQELFVDINSKGFVEDDKIDLESGMIDNVYKMFDESPERSSAAIRTEFETHFSDVYVCESILSEIHEQIIDIQEVPKYEKDTTITVNIDVILDNSSDLIFSQFKHAIRFLCQDVLVNISCGESIEIVSLGDIEYCVCDFWEQKSLKEGMVGMGMVMELFDWKPGWLHRVTNVRTVTLLKNGMNLFSDEFLGCQDNSKKINTFAWKPGWIHCSNDVVVIPKVVNESEVKDVEEVDDDAAFIGKSIGLLIKDEMGKWFAFSDIEFGQSSKRTLTDIQVRVVHDMRVAMCGTADLGKLNIQSYILGEVPRLSGRVKLIGSEAYVCQSPWIKSRNIEETILFSKKMDTEEYDKVLEACTLKTDLEVLSFGDSGAQSYKVWVSEGSKLIDIESDSGSNLDQFSKQCNKFEESEFVIFQAPDKTYRNEVGAYYESEQPGKASQANVLEFVDRYLIDNVVSSSPEVTILKILRLPFASSAKGSLIWAMTTTVMPKTDISIFEWDSHQLDHGEVLFLKKERELYNQREKCLDGKIEDGVNRSVTVSSNEKFQVNFVWDDLAHGKGVRKMNKGLSCYKGEGLHNNSESHCILLPLNYTCEFPVHSRGFQLYMEFRLAEQDLMASLMASGLPTHEEIFSISSYSDDEDDRLPLKEEYGHSVKMSLKGMVAMMKLWKKYLMHEYVEIVKMASRALCGIFSTERGCQGNARDKTFETWIRQLLFALLYFCDEIILRLYQDVVLPKAICRGSYLTAMLYVDHWCQRHFNNLTLGSPVFSHVKSMPNSIEVLVSAVTQLDEQDSLYGIIKSHKRTFQIITSEHKGNWSKTLEYSSDPPIAHENTNLVLTSTTLGLNSRGALVPLVLSGEITFELLQISRKYGMTWASPTSGSNETVLEALSSFLYMWHLEFDMLSVFYLERCWLWKLGMRQPIFEGKNYIRGGYCYISNIV